MLRLTFLLCASLFLVMLLGGRDFGQMRPGLALAEAEAKAKPLTAKVPEVETVALASDAVAKPVAIAEVVAEPVVVPKVAEVVAPVVANAAPAPILVAPDVAVAAVAPAPATDENAVFTLSAFANPGADTAPVLPEQAAEGEIWYVAGNSLNVRAGPSTNDEVVGKLTRGEATLVVSREGEDWARIRIEGDGIDGYVAMRFLTAEVPVVN